MRNLKKKPHEKYSIDQEELRKNLSLYNKKADEYFSNIKENPYHLNKPFENPLETPEFLWRFALVLSNLRIGAGHTVLDFGCGTCWTSELLKRMDLMVYSLDVSQHALDIGKRVVGFDKRTQSRGKIDFIMFDGKTIPLPENHVDRILCFDSFHHVPNCEAVLKEFFRILRPGGIVGFSEPGWGHSKSPQSIKEMETYEVVENDILIDDIWKIAVKSGFNKGWVKPCLPIGFSIPINEFRSAKFGNYSKSLNRIVGNQFENMSIFFLQKGDDIWDSRYPSRLTAEIRIPDNQIEVNEFSEIKIPITIKNTGDTRWLSKTFNSKGEVRLGVHLYDKDFKLLNLDFDRLMLPMDVDSGEMTDIPYQRHIQLSKGEYILCFDMVSECIKWFNDDASLLTTIKLKIK
ncbi:MAG: class I SAM-dependent methyltransferase [Deltaproteobacteria bacterium]|nr:class I SAM-dependent methyltransferase [Deltaproteobacteria bacterium]